MRRDSRRQPLSGRVLWLAARRRPPGAVAPQPDLRRGVAHRFDGDDNSFGRVLKMAGVNEATVTVSSLPAEDDRD